MDIVKQIESLTAKIEQKTAELNALIAKCESLQATPIDWLLKTVPVVCGISPQELTSVCRKREYVIARQVFSYAANQFFGIHTAVIAKHLNKDRTTVIHAINVASDLLFVNDPRIVESINQIKQLYELKDQFLQPCLQSAQVV